MKHPLDPEGERLLELSKTGMQSSDPSARPSLETVLSHDYFQCQSYLKIVDFLSQMALKTQSDKDEFFRTLTPRLKALPEKVVATQLTSMLLSRYRQFT